MPTSFHKLARSIIAIILKMHNFCAATFVGAGSHMATYGLDSTIGVDRVHINCSTYSVSEFAISGARISLIAGYQGPVSVLRLICHLCTAS